MLPKVWFSRVTAIEEDIMNSHMIYGLAYIDRYGNKWYAVGKAQRVQYNGPAVWFYTPDYMTLNQPSELVGT